MKTKQIALTGSVLGLGVLAWLTFPIEEVETTVSDLRVTEVQANTYTFSSQEDPSIATDSEGRMLVTWSSRRQENGNYGVFAQLLDPLGRPLGTELHVNESVVGAQQDAYVAFAPDGSAWVTWRSLNRGMADNGIFARRFAETDEGFGPVGGEVRVQCTKHDVYTDPVVAVNADGEVLVAWVKNEPAARTIHARRISSSGELLGEPFLVGADDAKETVPDAVALPDGAFFVAWSRADVNSKPLGIFGRRIENGQAGVEVVLNDLPDRMHVEPSIDVDAEGRLLVAWMAAESDAGYTVRARRFDSQGAALGASFEVEAGGEGLRNGATAVSAPDGRFLVAYNDYGGKYSKANGEVGKKIDIRALEFDADGRPVGEGFQINSESEGKHTMQSARNGRHADWTEHGQIAFAWTGKTTNDGSGVGVSIYSPASFAPPAPPAVEPQVAAADLLPTDTVRQTKPDRIPPELRNRLRQPSESGSGFVAHDETIWDPPDPDIAVGPNHVVTQVNMEIAWFTKDGTEQFRQDNNGPTGFWADLGGGGFIFDPISLWDVHSQRFIIANSELDGGTDYLCLAVSVSDDPNDGWHRYRNQVSPTCSFPDFPNLGVDEEAIYITTDCFSGGGNRVFIYDKNIVTVGGALPGTPPSVQMNTGFFSLGNTKNFDSGSPAHYMISSFGAGGDLALRALQDPNGSPTVSSFTVNVSPFSSPPDASQMGSSNLLSTVDERIKSGVVRNGHLYASHTIGSGGVARTRWYDIDLRGWPDSGNTPVLDQEGTLNFGAGVHNWFADISCDANDSVTMAFNRSSSSEFASIQYVYRLATDPPNTMSAPVLLQGSSAPYTGSRYGDYSGIDEDATVPGRFWSHAEYVEGPWVTRATNWDLPALASATVRNGSGLNDLCYSNLSLPHIGGNYTANVSKANHPGGTTGWIFWYDGPLDSVFLGFGELLVDLGTTQNVAAFSPFVGDDAFISTAIPNDAALAGVFQATQGLILGGGPELCNAIDLILEFP